MRVSTKPRHRNAPRIAEKSAPGFLQYVRGRECLCAGSACGGKIEAAHVDYAGGKGIGTKVADRYAIPLCSFHHGMQHSIGWVAFDHVYLQRYGGGLRASETLWKAWPGRIAWERKLEASNG